jgi:hypothetical protein
MTTNKKPLRCGICGETSGKYTYRTGRFSSAQTIGPFTDQQALVGHKRFVHYEEYKAATAKARITREARQRAELEAAQKAKAHMETASVRVVQRHGGYDSIGGARVERYDMKLTYQAAASHVEIFRHPSAEALAWLEMVEDNLRIALRDVEAAKVAAWESGTPVTLEEVLAARAAGEKDANLR